jgi:long-chain acyl-CoA synthetase
VGSRKELLTHPEIHSFLDKEIHRMMADFARYEQVKKFILIAEELTQDNGFLTPTLKYKRRLINEHFKHEIAELFADSGRD